MISYPYIFGEFAKLVDWFSESLFLKNFISRRTMRSKRGRCGCGFHDEEEEHELGLGLGSVRLTRSFGRKRILMSSTVRESLSNSAVEIPSPKLPLETQRSRTIVSSTSEKSVLESLPLDQLVNVIRGVDHEDLNSLIIVSKRIKEASLIARRDHFAYNTPKKNSNSNHPEVDIEPPNAPIRNRWTKAKRKEQLKDIAVELFK